MADATVSARRESARTRVGGVAVVARALSPCVAWACVAAVRGLRVRGCRAWRAPQPHMVRQAVAARVRCSRRSLALARVSVLTFAHCLNTWANTSLGQ
eukprot:3170443-Prymnesium_polylepis.1